MNVSKQKVFLYIPVLNLSIIIFSWLLFYYRNNVSKIRFIKNVIKIFAICFIITIPRIVVDKITDILVVENILLWIYILLYMYIPCLIAIKDQMKYINEQNW